jgi:hypothetical protein
MGNKRGRGEGAAQKSGHRAIYFISQILGLKANQK